MKAATLPNPPGVMTTREAAKFLRLSERTLATLVKQGVIPSFRLGRQHRFSTERLQEWTKAGGRGNQS